MLFRHDINALRALAVLSVVFYHFKVDFISAGFIGVDIFFVISGYLMTSIILNKINKNNFNIVDFYIDRIFRIVPALFVLSLFVLLFGILFLYTPELKQVSKEIIASNLFLSNFYYYKNSGYFDTSSELMLMLHTWSLAVEWQFYILYPLILIFLHKIKLPLKYILITLFTASFGASIYYTPIDQSAGFYLLHTRAWELFAGSLIYLFPVNKNQRLLFILGLTLILYSILTFDTNMEWPGIYALVPVLGTFLLLQANFNHTITNNKILQFIGKISYSVYLWHWPIVVIFVIYGVDFNFSNTFIGICVSLLLGYLSYTIVEKPCLKIKNSSKSKKHLLALSLPVFVITPALSYGIYKKDGDCSQIESNSEKSEFIQKYLNIQKNIGNYYMSECDFYQKSAIDPSCTQKNAGKELSLFLWGDSHAQALSYGLRSILDESHVNFYQVATGGCYPSLTHNDRSGLEKNNCILANQYALDKIKAIQPDIVVIAQRDFHEEVNWNEIAGHLQALGVKHIVLIGPIPQFNQSLPVLVARDKIFHDKQMEYFSKQINTKILQSNDLIKTQRGKKYHYISLIDTLCKNNSCKVIIDKETRNLLLFDYGHLTPDGSLFVGTILEAYFAENGFKKYLNKGTR